MSSPTSSAARRRGLRSLVALGRARLGTSFGARAALTLAAIVCVVFAASAIGTRVSDGASAPIAGIVSRAAKWLVWLAGMPLALSIARERVSRDRAEGIDALAASRGLSGRALDAGRGLAAMLHAAILLGVPLVALATLSVGLAGTGTQALKRAALVPGAVAFSVLAGGVIGIIGAACARLGGKRGRLLLAAVVLLPWMLASELGHASWSIPGALDAVRSFVLPKGVASAAVGPAGRA